MRLGSCSVTGSYSLYKILQFSNISGSIKIDFEPKDPDKDNGQPAILRLSSKSGSSRVLRSTVSVPTRD